MGTRWHYDRRIAGAVYCRYIVISQATTAIAAGAAASAAGVVMVMMMMVLVVMVAGRNGSGRVQLLLLLLVAGRDLGRHAAVAVRTGRIIVGVELLLLLRV